MLKRPSLTGPLTQDDIIELTAFPLLSTSDNPMRDLNLVREALQSNVYCFTSSQDQVLVENLKQYALWVIKERKEVTWFESLVNTLETVATQQSDQALQHIAFVIPETGYFYHQIIIKAAIDRHPWAYPGSPLC